MDISQTHNVQKAKEATDPQNTSTQPHTWDPQTFMDRILESTDLRHIVIEINFIEYQC